MAILNTYKNELGIAELVTRQWPAEKRERLLKELEKSEKEKEHDKIVATAMRLYL